MHNIGLEVYILLICTITFTLTLLKLSNKLDWSWWWIASPIWMSILGILLLTILYILIEPRLDEL